MAHSRFEYVKEFEKENYLLPDTFIVIRVDGKGFHKFSEKYNFQKPNDIRALNVMNRASEKVVRQFPDILLAYGDSDEYSFLLRRNCNLFERREMKLVSTFASAITSHYYYEWNQEFPEKALWPENLPMFDSRAVVYPSAKHVRDYFSWRQVDCHINNLYNTTFWSMVEKANLTPKEAENKLMGTVSSDKNEILFKDFGINYNDEPDIFKKGTIIVREYESWKPELESDNSARQRQRIEKKRKRANIAFHHVDIIKDDFWSSRPWLLE
ncbi:uncharacterized protein PRCAT00001751001 [Priceomyces carsonii]|uniref:uncharacterized protein n=1 Tax=Priceomyces carsonii TaxID=28549 RepID=UPI002ED88503|nr:unnamed protein product [Priceomyces carsonii]